MGQCASKRASKRQHEFNKSIKEVNSSKKVWMMVKIEEFEALQNSSSDSQKNIDKLRGQFLCQSTLLKEIIDDMLKLQNNENEELKHGSLQTHTGQLPNGSSIEGLAGVKRAAPSSVMYMQSSSRTPNSPGI
mgnify:CR=1 FL=1